MENQVYNMTNKIYEILNQLKGFDILRINNETGVIIYKYQGIEYKLYLIPTCATCVEKDSNINDILKRNGYIDPNSSDFHLYPDNKGCDKE